MVKPLNIRIPAYLNGATEVSVPLFSGIDCMVYREGFRFLDVTEAEILAGGGFKLIKPGDVLHENETFTLFPTGFAATVLPVTYHVRQYPHVMTIVVPADTVQNGNGDFEPATDPLVYQTMCRAEPAKGNQYITGMDGNQVSFSSIVYMPLPVTLIPAGAKITVTYKDRIIINDQVKQFYEGQLNARAWV